MKYGMHSCGLKSYPIKEALKKAGEFGYDGFEIDIFPLANDRSAWEKYRENLVNDIPEMIRIGKDAGIEINSLCLGVLWFVNIAGDDDRERDLGVSIIKDCIEIGAKLGANCLLLPIGQPEEVSPPKARDNLYHSIERCIEHAEKYNIVLAVENVVQRVLWNSSNLIELIDRLDSPLCKVYYDVGNPYFVQINPAEEIVQLNNRIFQFHVKDMQEVKVAPVQTKAENKNDTQKEVVKFRGDTANWKGKKDATIETGIVNWPAIITAIQDIGFDRYLVTEIQQDVEQPDVIAKKNISALRALGQKIQMKRRSMMGTRSLITNPREIGYGSYEERALKSNEVRLKTIFSGISQGTELTVYRGLNPYMLKKWDSQKKLFLKSEETSLKYPTESGYEAVGQIVETGDGVTNVKAGDVIYGGEWYGWTHKTTHILSEDAALRQKMPAHVNPKLGVFVALLQTSFNGILDAQVNLGETIVVFGAGIVGQLALLLLKLSGVEVVVVDLFEERLAIAKKLGADEVINGSKINAGEYIKDKTNGRGADVCIEATGNDLALHESIRCCAYSGKVISLGFNPNPATRLNLGEEFHHNRITIVCSQIAGVNPALLNRWDVYRVEDVVVKMLYEGKLNLEPLITHEFDFNNGKDAFDLADRNPQNALQIILRYA